MTSKESTECESEQLIQHTDWPNEDGLDHRNKPRRPGSFALLASACLNLFLLLIVAVSTSWTFASPGPGVASGAIYSPADEATRYETVVFHSGLHGDTTPYIGYGSQVDESWEGLYNEFGLSLISQQAASKLPNRTAAASFDESKHVVQIDVFHQLHCLNMLRKLLYPEVYGREADAEELLHLEHCVESLRQSLQCHSDTATIFWEWSARDQMMKGNTATTHTCKDFNKIQQWAREHLVEDEDDFSVLTEGAPLRSGG